MIRQRIIYKGLFISGLWATIIIGCGSEDLMPPPCHEPQCGDAVPRMEQEEPIAVHPSALKSVVSSITLPTYNSQFSLDLNGDHVVDNQIGKFLGLLKSMFGVDLQGVLNEQLTAGKAILIYEVLAESLTDTDQAEIMAYLGTDTDDNPADNFSGLEVFQVEAQRWGDPVLMGSIKAGQLTTQPGPGLVAIPFRSSSTVLMLRRTQIKAQVSSNGMTQGILAGAVPMDQLVYHLLPVLAVEISQVYRWPELSSTYAQLIDKYLDLDDDGAITVQELKDSQIFGLMLQTADVDTDSDGTPDAISFGVAFTSVPCGTFSDE